MYCGNNPLTFTDPTGLQVNKENESGGGSVAEEDAKQQERDAKKTEVTEQEKNVKVVIEVTDKVSTVLSSAEEGVDPIGKYGDCLNYVGNELVDDSSTIRAAKSIGKQIAKDPDAIYDAGIATIIKAGKYTEIADNIKGITNKTKFLGPVATAGSYVAAAFSENPTKEIVKTTGSTAGSWAGGWTFGAFAGAAISFTGVGAPLGALITGGSIFAGSLLGGYVGEEASGFVYDQAEANLKSVPSDMSHDMLLETLREEAIINATQM